MNSTDLNNKLLILFHGIGGSGSSMLPIATAWRHALPHTRIFAPDGPFPYGGGIGHQWFGLDGKELQPERIQAVRRRFDQLIEDVIRKEGFENRRRDIAFLGVSQGAIMALDAVATGRWQVGAVVSFAGLLPPGTIPPGAKDTVVLLIHGASDMTIPAHASVDAAARLKKGEFNVTLDIEPGIGHTISMEGAQKALVFLQRYFL